MLNLRYYLFTFQRFQRLYHAFEQEAASEKKQLIALHQQRVQAIFNKKKRVLMASYKQELEAESPVVSYQPGYSNLHF